MATIVTRSGKGTPLTNNEVDANFNNLNTDKAELSGAVFTGAITTNSTIDGRDVATDGTKLDTVETNADITDATNVTAAGALMDSEVTNLAQVKAFASSDYATAAQGTKADASLPKAGGAMTGAITTNSTFDGRDVAADGATADAALPKSGGAMTGAITTNSTFDGVDIATRDGVLSTTTTTANAALPKSGGAMTGAITTNSTIDGRDVAADGVTADAALPRTGGAMTGAITTNSTFDGRDVAADGVTADAALPKSGGAMTGAITTNSTFDGRDVAADGVTADAALPKSGGAMTGAITTNSTFDGVDVGTRDAVLTSTTTTANAALPKAGGTMTGALIVNETTAVTMSAGTTAQRPTGVAGMFRYNTTEDKFEGYSTTWGEIGGGAADLRVNSFTGNGSTTAYTLTTSPDLSNTLAYIDGVYQVKAAYAMSGQTLTFTAAPDNGALIEITAATVAPVQESTDFLLNQYTGNGSTTAFTLSAAPTNENQCSVFISGVYQSKANFSVSGSTLTFSTAPPNGSAIEVMCARTVVFSAGTPDDNTVSTAKIQDDAVTSAKVDSTVATVAGTETLTNKTLTAPDINTPDIDGGTIDGTVIGGATPAAISGTSGSFDVTADGAIVTYKKSGTTVGSIGTGYGVVDIKGGTSGLLMGNTAVLPVNGSGTLTTDSYDIGAGSYRFKDLYLSGGVVFGPASASNVSSQTLDSYEEGSFTATLTATTAPSSAQTQTCYYTKIGNLVSVFIRFTNKNTTGASGDMKITGLPFTSSSNGTNNASTPMLYNLTISDKYVSGYVGASTSYVGFLNNRTNNGWTSTQINANGAVYLNMNLTYQVA